MCTLEVFKEGDNHPISWAFSQRNGEEDTKEVSVLGKAPTFLGHNLEQIGGELFVKIFSFPLSIIFDRFYRAPLCDDANNIPIF